MKRFELIVVVDSVNELPIMMEDTIKSALTEWFLLADCPEELIRVKCINEIKL